MACLRSLVNFDLSEQRPSLQRRIKCAASVQGDKPGERYREIELADALEFWRSKP